MGCIFFVFIAFILVGCSGRRSASTRNLCNRDPPNTSSRRTPGDNGLRIQVLGHSEKYTPGQVYTISINGTYPNQRLVGFMLVAVPLNAQDETTAMGTFQLIDTVQTKFATECPHVVTHTNLRPKAGVEVLWTAPAPRVGCIEFRATVIERDSVWFKDDGALTRQFCEDTGRTESERSAELTPDCCACGSAKYQMTFEGKWSQQSHPKDYPTQRRLLHWSNIVGASHSKNYMVWQYDDYATKGVKEVCEFGYPRTTEQEIQSHSREVRSIIKTSGIWYSEPHGINQKRDARFSTDRRRHLVSMLTMVGPSPDWCVGISAVDLCLPNCTWTKEITFDLYPWDAGTDDGISFMSPNAKSDPQQKIHRITNTFPNNVASPFYGRDPVRPLASLKIERLSGKDGDDSSCSTEDTDDSDVDIIGGGGGAGGDGLSDMDKQKLAMMQDGKCAVSAWEDWSGCSVTCGVGQRFRKRMYLNSMVDETMCGLPVMESENCIGLENECETIDEDCAVTQWSNWSPCSVTCGKGTRDRRRFYLVKEDMVRCNRTTEELEMCAAAILDCDGARARKNFTAICSLPSLAGPCRGNFERWYFDVQMQKCLPFVYGGCRGNDNRFETMDECTEACSLFHDTEERVQETTQRAIATRARCSLPSLSGTCRGNFERWYFDVQMQKCLPFVYGGCRGNDNRFETMDECTEACALFHDTEERVQEPTTVATRSKCSLPSLSGPCRANLERWYFDVQMQKCLPFVYGGCQGNDNRFETMDECTEVCSLFQDTEERVQEPTQRTTTAKQEICHLPRDPGPCRSKFDSWYFDTAMQKCLPFSYGGCFGNQNRFSTAEVCFERCIESAEQPIEVTSLPSILTVKPSNELSFSANSRRNHPTTKGSLRKPSANGRNITNKSPTYPPPVDCMISPWTEWSSCSVSCGAGFHVRQRMIKREPENGGKSCPVGLEKRKKCKMPPCDASTSSSSCQLGPWGQWSPCSKTCGDGIQERVRQMINNGVQARCKLHMQRRICVEELCPTDSKFL